VNYTKENILSSGLLPLLCDNKECDNKQECLKGRQQDDDRVTLSIIVPLGTPY
jgi:hypothetical protein